MTLSKDYKEKVDQLWQKYLEDPAKNKDLLFGILFLTSKIEQLETDHADEERRREKYMKAMELLEKSGSISSLAQILVNKLNRDFVKENMEDEISALKQEIEKLKEDLESERNKVL